MTKKIFRRTIGFLIVSVLSRLSISFMFAVYTVFLLSRGLTLDQAALVNMTYHLAVPLLEVPTGAYADVWGRKNSFLASCVIWVVAMVVYGSSHSLAGFILAELAAAFATTLASGCDDAHLWDSVVLAGQEDGLSEEQCNDHNRTVTTWKAYGQSIVSAFGGLLGGYLAARNFALPWFVGAGGFAATFILGIVLIKETQSLESHKISNFLADAGKLVSNSITALALAVKEKKIRDLVILRLAMGAALLPLFMFWQPQFTRLGVSTQQLGWIWVGMELFSSLGFFLAAKIARKTGDERLMVVSVLASAVVIFVIASAKGIWPVLVTFLVFEALVGAYEHTFKMKSQTVITELGRGDVGASDNMRATILSLKSMAGGVGAAIGLAIGGQLAEHFSITTSWLFGGIVMLAAAFSAQRVLKGR